MAYKEGLELRARKQLGFAFKEDTISEERLPGAFMHDTEQTKKIEASIWKQIDNGNENDYIHFHLRRADESYLPVLDHGRIVESQQYGKVFYVLFMDWEDMNSYYSEKFSR